MTDYPGHDRRTYNRDDLEQVAYAASERVARETVPKVIAETFVSMGIDPTDKIGMQKQMQYLRESAEQSMDPEIKEDRAWTRKNRKRCEAVYSAALSGFSGLMVKGFALLLLAGVVAWLAGVMKKLM